MTNEIQKNKWKQFFDQMSLEKLNWQAKVEVLKADLGSQVLAENLPLMGVMFEEKSDAGQGRIEIMLGDESGAAHQTHTIFNPTKVAYLENDAKTGGTLEIEDESGAKTLLEIALPLSFEVTYTEVGIVAG